MNDKVLTELLEETQAVKMLLVLQLLGQGFKQSQIAKMLSVSDATMSRMLPKGIGKSVGGKVKPIGGESDA